MRTLRVAGLLLLAGACAHGAGRAPSDETQQLQQEVRALEQEILAFKPPAAAHGQSPAKRVGIPQTSSKRNNAHSNEFGHSPPRA